MPKISVIVPVYNVDKYLSACLDSLISQTSGDFEIIVVDDGSTDKSPAMCDAYAAEYPDRVTVIHQENKGLGGARNTGIKAATGDYLFFLDSDDTVDPDALERLGGVIEKTDADMVLCGVRVITPDGKDVEYPLPYEDETVLFPKEDKAVLTGTPEAPLKITKRNLFSENGIEFPSKVWYEDLRTTPKLLAAAEKVVVLKEPFYNYCRREGSIMNNKNVERNREIIDAMEDLRLWFSERGLFDKYRDELEFLTIDHVLVSATVRVLRTAPSSHPLVGEFRRYTEKFCRDIKKNSYVSTMPGNRKVILGLLLKKLYLPVTFIFRYIKK